MISSTLRMTREAASALGELLPGEARTGWRELDNKLHAYEWFSFAGPRLTAPGEAAPPPLAEQARRAAALADPFDGIWAMEGLGYAWARAAAGRFLPPRELDAERLASLPAAACAPVHTGSALAVAEGLLGALGRGGDDRRLVRSWLDRCRDDLSPGYAELAAEALGLVARQLQPCRLRRLDELLAAARRPAGEGNAIAGLAWALTLVNLRSPAVVEAAVAGCGGGPGVDRAIAHGAAGALLVWRQWAGAEAWLARFLDHRPAAADRGRRWRRRIVDPCRAALAGDAGDLRRRDHLAALFRLQVPA